MIYIKWLTNWDERGGSKNAPGIINLLINMPLKMGSTVNNNKFIY